MLNGPAYGPLRALLPLLVVTPESLPKASPGLAGGRDSGNTTRTGCFQHPVLDDSGEKPSLAGGTGPGP